MIDATKIELEVVEHLRRVCRTLRGNRARPELAIPAAQWEGKLNDRMAELEKLQTADLPLKERKVAA